MSTPTVEELAKRMRDFAPPKTKKCPKCNGTGQQILHAATVRPCPNCYGKRRVPA